MPCLLVTPSSPDDDVVDDDDVADVVFKILNQGQITNDTVVLFSAHTPHPRQTHCYTILSIKSCFKAATSDHYHKKYAAISRK